MMARAFSPETLWSTTNLGRCPRPGMERALGAQFTYGLIVPKEKIAANGDYNLSGERYRAGVVSKTAYPLVPVGRIMKEGVKTVDPRNSPDEMFELWSIPAFDAAVPNCCVVAEIQTHSKPVIEHCYREFLLQNHDPDEREYPDAADQIREVLIHGNYLSQKDIEICLGFGVESLADRPSIEGMRELHAALVEKYKVEDANSAG